MVESENATAGLADKGKLQFWLKFMSNTANEEAKVGEPISPDKKPIKSILKSSKYSSPKKNVQVNPDEDME